MGYLTEYRRYKVISGTTNPNQPWDLAREMPDGKKIVKVFHPSDVDAVGNDGMTADELEQWIKDNYELNSA